MSIIPPNAPLKASPAYTACIENKYNTSSTPFSSGVKNSYAQKMLERSKSVLSEAQSEAPLGNFGKSSRQHLFHALKPNKDKGSEDFALEKEEYNKSRRMRYELQRTLIKLFKGKTTPKGASFNFHNCKVTPIGDTPNTKKSASSGAKIVYSYASETARYEGLQSCKKIACPHCAEVKALKDKKILEAIKACHARAGGGVIMMTLTNSHHKGMKLSEQIEKQKKAIDKFNKALSKMAFWEEFSGRVGSVRAWEILYGFNGWHPHFHFLIYTKEDLTERDENGKALEEQPTLQIIRNSLSEEWIKACISSGLPAPSFENGVDIRDGTHADKYVGKYGDEIINMKGGWGSSAEMTRSNLKNNDKSPRSLSELKKGDKGFTPWQLLIMAHEGCEKSAELYIEYVYATYGTSPLYFYPGTKKLYDYEAEIKVIEQQQKELVSEQFEDNVIPEDKLFIELPDEMIRAVSFCDKRAQLLEAAEADVKNGDFEHRYNTMALINRCLKEFLAELEKRQRDEERKAKINQIVIDTKIDEQLRKSNEETPPDVSVKFLSLIEKKVQSRVGSKSLNDGIEILNAIYNLPPKTSTIEPIPAIPDWVNDVPVIDSIPPEYEQYCS